LSDWIRKFQDEVATGQELKWLSRGAAEGIEVLFRMGILGIPNERSFNPDWPGATYVTDEYHLTARNQPMLYMRPALWHFMTKIQQEMLDRRREAIELYRALRSALSDFDQRFDDLSVEHSDEFEYDMARFLVISGAIHSLNNYGEPVDWRACQN